MIKSRVPVCMLAAAIGAGTYLAFTLIAYSRYPLPFSPGENWLSDLGNLIDNPLGAAFYNVGVVLTAVFVAVWFAGLSQWRLEYNTAHQRLLAVAQTAGILSSVALILSALNPINMLAIHSLFSQLHFILSGIAFGFSAAALRYHPCVTAKILYLGVLAAVLPSVMFVIGKGKAYWMEWLTIGAFMLYILTVGRQSQALKQRVRALA